MNNVVYRNGKILEETVEGSNPDVVKTTLRSLRDFKIVFKMDFKKPSRHSSVTLPYLV